MKYHIVTTQYSPKRCKKVKLASFKFVVDRDNCLRQFREIYEGEFEATEDK